MPLAAFNALILAVFGGAFNPMVVWANWLHRHRLRAMALVLLDRDTFDAYDWRLLDAWPSDHDRRITGLLWPLRAAHGLVMAMAWGLAVFLVAALGWCVTLARGRPQVYLSRLTLRLFEGCTRYEALVWSLRVPERLP